jgi:hypothetical protein
MKRKFKHWWQYQFQQYQQNEQLSLILTHWTQKAKTYERQTHLYIAIAEFVNNLFKSGAMKNKQELLTIEGQFRWPPIFGRDPYYSTSFSVLCFFLVCVFELSLLN